MRFLLFFLLLFSGTTYADEATQAEYRRLARDMERLSKRQVWQGVDKRFRELQNTKESIEFEHCLIGAQAAQELGNMENVQDRLQLALKVKRKKRVINWLSEINENYGRVTLKATSKGEVDLLPNEMPMDPIKNKSIVIAQNRLQEKGEFSGLLPTGEYTFIGHPFTVDSGVDIKLAISPKQRKKGLGQPIITRPDDIVIDED